MMPGLFARSIRPVILAAGRADRLRRIVERLPVTRTVVRRFVAGETLDAVLENVAALRKSGRYVSIDYLGRISPIATAPTRPCRPTWICSMCWAGAVSRYSTEFGRWKYR